MDAKLIVNGKEIEVDITAELIDTIAVKRPSTCYDRVPFGNAYYYVHTLDMVNSAAEQHRLEDDAVYNLAIYYNTPQACENDLKADILLRKLRRFSKQEQKVSLYDPFNRYYIVYDSDTHDFSISKRSRDVYSGPYFDSLQTAAKAIEEFREDLIWYFTVYMAKNNPR